MIKNINKAKNPAIDRLIVEILLLHLRNQHIQYKG